MSANVPTVAAVPRRWFSPHAALSTRNRVGLILTFLIGLTSVPSVAGMGEEPKDGFDSPPAGVLVLATVCGVIMVVTCWNAWRSASRNSMRVAAGTSIVQAVATVPAFFVDIESYLKVASALSFLVSVVGIVLILSPDRGPAGLAD